MFSLSLSLSRLKRLALTSLAACLAWQALADVPGQSAHDVPGYAPKTKQGSSVDRVGLAPYHQAEKPIRDTQGRTKVIVDFVSDAHERYHDAARTVLEKFDPKRDRHNPQVLLLIEDVARQYGIELNSYTDDRGLSVRSNITTWAGASIVAYLDDNQINLLRKDERVRLISQDSKINFSSGPPWYPSWNGPAWTELDDWGWHAVGGKSVLPGSATVVYIIDSGVAHHADLGSVQLRHNVSGNNIGVGCYAHATHVAGIIGATRGNSIGRSGIYAGVSMVSLNGGENYGYWNNPCAAGISASDIGFALDYVISSSFVLYTGSHVMRPRVVNLSMNGNTLTAFVQQGSQMVAQSNQVKMTAVAQPRMIGSYYYPGAVVVQSAGNFSADSCDNAPPWPYGGTHAGAYAYKPSATGTAHPSDGILVVGGIDSNGNYSTQFSAPYPNVTGLAGGSNFGQCIDIWAPANFIYSTWGQGSANTYQYSYYGGGQPAYCASMNCTSPPESGWAWLSGTSMAAPHVAAAAAYYIDAFGMTTPGQVEAALRANAQNLASGLKMVKIP